MASIAAKAERLARAVQAVEEAMGDLAAAGGVDAPSLPISRDPMMAQAMRLEAVAGFLRSLAGEPAAAGADAGTKTVRRRG
jgi:hypothetical protein